MGMYGILRRASTADVARLRANPELVEAFLFGEPPVMVDDRPPGLLGFLLRFTPIKVQRTANPQPPRSAPPAWPPAAAGEELNIDKAWHGLHFLFTGTADEGEEPACFLLHGGEDIGEDDDLLPRLLGPAQVRAFAAFLAALTPEELTRRFDPERMTALEIYPDVIWQRPEDTDQPLGFLLGAFDELRAFTAAAAAAGDAVVVCVA
jgi:hypothetical protein